jgi:hypothetical protein
MASSDLSRRVEKVVGYPPLSELGDLRRRKFHEALLDANALRDRSDKWRTTLVEADAVCPGGKIRRCEVAWPRHEKSRVRTQTSPDVRRRSRGSRCGRSVV